MLHSKKNLSALLIPTKYLYFFVKTFPPILKYTHLHICSARNYNFSYMNFIYHISEVTDILKLLFEVRSDIYDTMNTVINIRLSKIAFRPIKKVAIPVYKNIHKKMILFLDFFRAIQFPHHTLHIDRI